jgi:SNF2 family DNA or RNA helicase
VKLVWDSELREMLPGVTRNILSGRNSFVWPTDNQAIVTNYDVLPDSFLNPPPNVHIVYDEVHYLKSTSSQRSKRARKLSLAVLGNGGKVWGLSATPLASAPDDLYGVTYALTIDTSIWGSYRAFFWLFRGYKHQMGRLSVTRWGQPRDEVPSLMRPFCLGRNRVDVLPDLPVKSYRTIEVQTGKIKEEEDVTVEELLQPRESGALSKARAAQAYAKARNRDVLDLIKSYLYEGPLVVFSAHVKAIEYISKVFDVPCLTGGSDHKSRAEAVEGFTEGYVKLLPGTIGAMGTGLTLTQACRVLFLDRSWIPADNVQAEDRVCRIGQTRGVEVIDIVSSDSHIDRNVFRLLRKKEAIINASIGASLEKRPQ